MIEKKELTKTTAPDIHPHMRNTTNMKKETDTDFTVITYIVTKVDGPIDSRRVTPPLVVVLVTRISLIFAICGKMGDFNTKHLWVITGFTNNWKKKKILLKIMSQENVHWFSNNCNSRVILVFMSTDLLERTGQRKIIEEKLTMQRERDPNEIHEAKDLDDD